MTLIWKSGYTTGVPTLDEQHRQVFEMLNQLEDLIARGEYDSPKVATLLKNLGTHITRHFNEEECCMNQARCPMAQKNKQEHEAFLNRFVDFTSRFSKGKSLAMLSGFHASAEGWLHEHIAFVDIHLRQCDNIK